MANDDIDEKLKVFISYSRRDAAAFADELTAGLELAGFAPLIDRQDISAGEDWEARLGGMIAECDSVVFVISPAAIASERCSWEIDKSRAFAKRIIPIVYHAVSDNELPQYLGRLQFVRFDSGEALNRSLAKLCIALRTDIEWIRAHTRLSAMADRWQVRGKPSSLLLRGDDLDAAKKWVAARQISAPAIREDMQRFFAASDDAEAARRAAELERQEEVRLARIATKKVKKSAVLLGAGTLALVLSLVGGHLYAAYVQRTASQCDALAVEPDNEVHISGVELDKILPDKAIPACQYAIAHEPNNPRLMHNLARAHDRAGQFNDAVLWYRKAADLKYSSSENNLGIMYLRGDGTPIDFAKGVQLIQASAEHGNARAFVNYTRTDYSTLFKNNPPFVELLQRALLKNEVTEVSSNEGQWTPVIADAVEKYKRLFGLPDTGVSLRLLVKLGIVNQLSELIGHGQRR